MKTTILLICSLVLSSPGWSQELSGKHTTSGKINFQERTKLEIKIEGDAAQFAESLPKEQYSDKVLYFNSDYSLYQNDDTNKGEDAMMSHDGQMNVQMIISGDKVKTFMDLKKNKKVEQKDFMTRMFLIESDMTINDWKLTGNFKVVLGYNCQEAVREDQSKKISAWFTPLIQVSTGPAGFGGLPGLILQVDIDNGKRIITAVSVDPEFNDIALLVRPKEGRKVTEAEFKQIVDEKMKEMGTENEEGGAHVIIRIKN